MSSPRISKETLRAMAGLSGLDLSDEKLEELLPQVQQAVESLGEIDVLNLSGVEPAVGFSAGAAGVSCGQRKEE